MRLLMLAIAMLAAAAPSAAQQPGGFEWRVGDERAPDAPMRAAKDGFGAMMLVTDDYDGFLKAWEGPTPPQVSVTETVRLGQPVHAMLLFSGCRADPTGNCNIGAALSIVGPDGSQYGETLEGIIWSGPPAPGYNLQLSEGNLGFHLEPEDALGAYTLRAALTDTIAGITVSVQQAVTAVAGD